VFRLTGLLGNRFYELPSVSDGMSFRFIFRVGFVDDVFIRSEADETEYTV
jgi:hypothetical protein